jgi:hypothetical protein
MLTDRPTPEETGEHPFQLAARRLEEACSGIRYGWSVPLVQSDDAFDLWHAHEFLNRPLCEAAAQRCLAHQTLPPLAPEPGFFLARRFDTVAEFLKNLVLHDGTTVFGHGNLSLDEFLRWMLFDWWRSNGIREAFFQDLEAFESTDTPQ